MSELQEGSLRVFGGVTYSTSNSVYTIVNPKVIQGRIYTHDIIIHRSQIHDEVGMQNISIF